MKLDNYLQIINEENTLKELNNPALIDRIVEFIRNNPFPKDHQQLHKWAKQMGYEESEDIEEYIYAMLTVILCGGASKGKEIKVPNDKNKLIGDQIELEHVEMKGINNQVVLKIQEVFENKIRNDHLAEHDNYYIEGADFLKELNREKKKQK